MVNICLKSSLFVALVSAFILLWLLQLGGPGWLEVRGRAATGPVKSLLLAYGRSGSSFCGDLLSASPQAAYYFEPIFIARNRLPAKRTQFEKYLLADAEERLLTDLFTCSEQLLQLLEDEPWAGQIVRKRGRECRESSPRVVKTIRLRRADLEPWIYDSDIKVVHLVRDPRAILRSRSLGEDWQGNSQDPLLLCASMLDDLLLAERMPVDRYVRVKYEDLVEDTEKTLFALYSHLGLPWTKDIKQVVMSHTHADKSKDQGYYYGTLRASNFTHDTWKESLSENQVREIEGSCQQFMTEAGYHLLYPSSLGTDQRAVI